jgi:outer membrane biosynthesis protein TonB
MAWMAMIGIRLRFKMLVWLAVTVLGYCPLAATATSEKPADDAALLASICPVVYPLDQFPTERGYGYLFFGNAFFINEEGYLVTAAHVLDSFRDGGQPYILVNTPGGPRRPQKAELVAEDSEHDVAILRATPNPFMGQHNVAFISLNAERPSPGRSVIAVSILPSGLSDAHTSDGPRNIRSQGQVIDYQFHVESKGTESELLLFDQKIAPGQSGSPVLSDSGEVVGIVIGQWLRPTLIHFGPTAKPLVTSPGAALRIHYAISLLRHHGIPWHTAFVSATVGSPTSQASSFSPPVPVSLVSTPYPPQALLGGEVVLDALIDTEGRIAELSVVHGSAPFLQPVLDAVHTWTFSPAKTDEQAVKARLGIVFQFPQSFLPKVIARAHKYSPSSQDSLDHAALPVSTMEPDYPINAVADESVILFNFIDQHGKVTSTQVLHGLAPFTATTLAALQKWQFVPGQEAGTNTGSAVVVVVTFRHP